MRINDTIIGPRPRPCQEGYIHVQCAEVIIIAGCLVLSKPNVMRSSGGEPFSYSNSASLTPAQCSMGKKRKKRKYRCRYRSPESVIRSKKIRRSKANARERKRMHSLNSALENLRKLLPKFPNEPTLTKIETLRMANKYINILVELLNQEPEAGTLLENKCETVTNEKFREHYYVSPYSQPCNDFNFRSILYVPDLNKT
ncbi:hypothetical protein AB6A40_004269 [Gnathostoma spinigerum]|uniref:BHLH domain-containing protein n=1 Tax=Gnathostoma spinigerum TaxID=75299 RepID=A0ABD6ED37_9BILA